MLEAAALLLSLVCMPTMHNVSPNKSARLTTEERMCGWSQRVGGLTWVRGWVDQIRTKKSGGCDRVGLLDCSG